MFNPEIITLFQKYIYIYPKRIKNYNTCAIPFESSN